MFRTDQIITSTELIKYFRRISRYLSEYPSPVLVTQKGAGYLVLVSAEVFEELLEQKFASDGVEAPRTCLRSYLES